MKTFLIRCHVRASKNTCCVRREEIKIEKPNTIIIDEVTLTECPSLLLEKEGRTQEVRTEGASPLRFVRESSFT